MVSLVGVAVGSSTTEELCGGAEMSRMRAAAKSPNNTPIVIQTKIFMNFFLFRSRGG